jgi:hypothetical protein
MGRLLRLDDPAFAQTLGYRVGGEASGPEGSDPDGPCGSISTA